MIVAGINLNAGERQALIRDCSGFRFEDNPSPGVIGSGDVCLPDLPPENLRDLLSWGLPVLVRGGETLRENASREWLLRAGLAALWIPGPDPFVIGPELRTGGLRPGEAPVKSAGSKRAGLFIAEEGLTTLFRQIFLFAGIESRSDFRDGGDFASVLPLLREDSGELHVVIDLDRGDFLPALHALGKEAAAGPRLRVWALRDFSRPGPDPVLIQRYLSPFTSRIFEPIEAILALVEALFLYDPSLDRFRSKADPLQTFDGFRDTERLLRGRSVQMLQPDPRRLWSATVDLLDRQRRALPFHWIFDLYADRQTGGVVLAESIGQ